MNLKRVKVEGATVPWRLQEGELTEKLEELPVSIKGTQDLLLRASVVGGGRVRITPQRGRIIEYSLHNIRNTSIYPEEGATYVLFRYHGVSYELGTVSPYVSLPSKSAKAR